MIIDITGIELTPGNGGKDCKGNGNFYECCCDECDYMLCCIDENWDVSDYVDLEKIHSEQDCKTCTDTECPRNENHIL